MNLKEMISIHKIPHSMRTCVTLWLSIYAISYYKNNHKNPNHFNSKIISNIHALVGITLAVISIYFNDESEFSEMQVLAWCTGYFMADLLDCIVRKDTIFLLHAVVGFSLLGSCSMSPFYEVRAASRGYFVELSNFFYNHWKTTKTRGDFRNFLLCFFFCRIVYTPIFLKRLNVNGDVLGNKFAVIASIAFYAMNFIWFCKGTQMYFNYDETNKHKKN
jgi:hypothetical protein